ncbi:4'-phosphopantetheinyl transferase superfamily protein [Vibrio tubiashii]|uniref:4'-phosphopantetheinyl transferase family protein n=1 Tax=Vibrio tubiashii TaxID=29498 RepID=UPI001EFEB01C|nr:4'-phosphopantetheinyl transferase superfamily protein [Vibrio tubiashii]MCG9583486.1 4'-phosphopantetheinyl transferase superfamily protein [Vibrio tubiashii]MCG9617063.1 4'-phosphopantetheinyl transferase superfamily protein [Vibrio tubiashii]MCG9686471.1 4'-phosphopantetheinyl transferase superfamily protein [Vibrio tubiashii]
MYRDFLTKLASITLPEGGLFEIERYIDQSGQAVLAQCDFDLAGCDIDLAATLEVQVPASVQLSVKKRQVEFIAGRYLANLCLTELMGTPSTVGIGAHREPIWPDGLMGAISHTHERAMALVAKREAFPFVGIDVEHWLDRETSTQIGFDIHDHNELDLLVTQGLTLEAATSLIFSAKESLFKATFPFIGRYFGFESARVVEFDRGEQTLVLMLEASLARYCLGQNLFRCQCFLQASTVTTVILNSSLDRTVITQRK